MPTKHTGYELPCEVCGKMFYQRLSRITRTAHQFCSMDCSRAYRQPIAERFWEKVDCSGGEGACWPWITRSRLPFGYGQFGVGDRAKHTMVPAHRFAFELAYGPIPDGMRVLHVCDNPACVRNDDEGWYEINGVLRPRRGHLFLGTDAENTADMIAKGRGGSQIHPERLPRGERHCMAKLTEADVRAIRVRYANGGVSYAYLGRDYGVSAQVIGGIINRLSWRHVE